MLYFVRYRLAHPNSVPPSLESSHNTAAALRLAVGLLVISTVRGHGQFDVANRAREAGFVPDLRGLGGEG